MYDDGNGPVSALKVHDDGSVPALDCPTAITTRDRFPDGPGQVVDFTVTASDDQDSSPAVQCVPPSGSVFPPGETMVQCTATDASGNQASCQFPVTVLRKAASAAPPSPPVRQVGG